MEMQHDGSKADIQSSVCRKHGCTLCNTYVLYVPEHCPYGILHAFAEDEPLLRPRQSGKTFDLVRRARQLLEEGTNVIFVCLCVSAVDSIRRGFWQGTRTIHPNGSEIRFLSVSQAMKGTMRGLNPCAVLTDELTPEQADRVMGELWLSWFDRGYYTPDVR